ncbi:hypothetical protein SISNIDRAFT_456384 [Sistotremastrum niveocremeum HHB9708]|uniref:DUF6533 domain-containing protein n=1 Tax=Sistotremastrum niveocremeum HHB9708 TaxID=1314777 RepID=A0A164SU07_9AGAM|nr:hypothetical protein SISNIDRAFT_456384 [Sistotremastrum niveocremeum HHB9708]
MPSNVTLLTASQTNAYSTVAAVAWMIWDIVTSLDDEIEYIWKSSWSLCKFLYFYSRYIGLASLITMGVPWNGWLLRDPPTSHYCHSMSIYQAAVPMFITLGVDLVLILRVYALYGCRRKFLFSILGFYAAEFISQLFVTIFGEVRIRIDPVLLSSDTQPYACIPRKIPAVMSGNWIPATVFQTLLFGLTFYKSFQNAFDKRFPTRYGKVLFIDGTWAFAVLAITSIACNVTWCLWHGLVFAAMYPWNVAVLSFVAAHLNLNLRKVYGKPASIIELTTLTDMKFHERETQELSDSTIERATSSLFRE